MNSTEDTNAQELVIIRRRSGGEEAAHKGGVWKIAYADFMTAMMAFFLVMWLINATDKQTLAQVATYFNPLRLTDRTANTKGVHDMKSGAHGHEDSPGTAKDQNGKSAADKKADARSPKHSEEALFRDPYGILTKLAVQAKRVEADGEARSGAVPKIEAGENLVKGEAFRDPFEPAYRKEAPGKEAAGQDSRPKGESGSDPVASFATDKILAKETLPARGAAEGASGGGTSDLQIAQKVAQERARQQKAEEERAEHEKLEQEQAKQAERAEIEAQIKRAVGQSALGVVPNIDVTVTDEGVLISLTDRFDFGMFRISSAEPRPELVVVMEKISKIIAPRAESLIIRGHTDGRPFKSGSYDNWRLSTARAHMAYHMLVRGGIAERRFERIEGHADHSLKVPDDPGAAQNRRIEILLRRPKP